MTRFYLNSIAISFLFLFSVNLYAQQNNRIRLAQALERSGDYEQALEQYLELYKSGQRGFTIVLGIQKSYTALNRYPELVQFMQELNHIQPNNLNHEINLGKAYFLNQQKEKAMAQWQASIKKRPKDISAYRLTARIMTELRLLDEAIDVYASAIKNIKNQQNLYREMAYIRRAQLNYEQATEYFLKYYRANKAQKNYVQSQFIAMAKDDEAAERIAGSIHTFLKNNPTDPALLEYQATLHIRLKRYADAYKIYLKLKNINLMNRFAEEARKGGAFSLAIAAYDEVLIVKQKENKRNAFRLKKALVLLDWAKMVTDPESVISKINQAQEILIPISEQKLDAANRWRALEILGDIQNTYLHQPSEALSLYQRTLKLAKVSSLQNRVQFKIAEIHLRQNALHKSVLALKRINGRQKSRAKYELALIDYYKGQFTAASEQLSQIQATLAAKDTLLNNVLSRLNQIREFQSDSGTLALFARAELLQRQNNLAQAGTAFAELVESNTSLSGTAALRAAKVYQKLGQANLAIKILEKALQIIPDFEDTDRVYFQLAGILEQQNHSDRALKYYLKLITTYPQSFLIDQTRERARRLQEEQGH